jgi:hypothetical protein
VPIAPGNPQPFPAKGGLRIPRPGEELGAAGGDDGARTALRTVGGEPMVVWTKNGRLQLRLAHPGKLTLVAEQAFLRALAATCNVRLSAAAAEAGFRARMAAGAAGGL